MRSRLARVYFALQAVAVTAWWLALWLRPEWRVAFLPKASTDAALLGFAPGDLLILGLGSGVVASLGTAPLMRRALAWLVTGATVYGALYTVTLAASGSASMIGAVLMVPAAVACIFAALTLDADFSALPAGGSR